MTALDPVYTIGRQIEETLVEHRGLDRATARRRARELLDLVQVPSPERCLASYPHEISGGMRQRAMIAIALACEPELLLADEPTTALDVTVQAQILWLLRDLQRRLGLAVIFVTHDLGVAAEIADDAAVMYGGRIVEQAPVRELFHAARASVYRRFDAGDRAPRPKRPCPRADSRRAAEPGRAAGRLRVRPALPARETGPASTPCLRFTG
jgi:ABC-type dipeptide/oligopeptide/nickel transport system ATPase component